MKKTIAKVSDETLRIENYLIGTSDGQFISYQEIEQNTGVKMNNAGKSYLRTALHRLNLEYSCVRGEGIKLADAANALTIVVDRVGRIDRAIKRGDRTNNNLISQFYNDMNDDDKKRILFVGSAYGALRNAARNSKLYLREIKPLANYDTPKLPESKR